jgi:hypothetical protein
MSVCATCASFSHIGRMRARVTSIIRKRGTCGTHTIASTRIFSFGNLNWLFEARNTRCVVA